MSPTDDMFGGGRHRKRMHRPTLFDVSVLPPYFSTSSPQDGNWEKLMVSPHPPSPIPFYVHNDLITLFKYNDTHMSPEYPDAAI